MPKPVPTQWHWPARVSKVIGSHSRATRGLATQSARPELALRQWDLAQAAAKCPANAPRPRPLLLDIALSIYAAQHSSQSCATSGNSLPFIIRFGHQKYPHYGVTKPLQIKENDPAHTVGDRPRLTLEIQPDYAKLTPPAGRHTPEMPNWQTR